MKHCSSFTTYLLCNNKEVSKSFAKTASYSSQDFPKIMVEHGGSIGTIQLHKKLETELKHFPVCILANY